MKISIIGANGMVGSAIAKEAASRNHDVTSYTRSGANNTLPLDLNSTDDVVKVINESDVTVISVASRDNYSAAIAAHQNIIAAKPTGRFLVIGGAGALQIGETKLFESPEFPAEYLEEATTFNTIFEEYLNSQDLLWTMIAPSPMIAPGVRTGKYLQSTDTPAGTFVSVEDFAVAAVDEIETPAHLAKRFTVASADENAAQGN